MSKKRRPPFSASESILSNSCFKDSRDAVPSRHITWDESNLRFNESILTSSFVKMKLRDLPPPPQSENEMSEEEEEDSTGETWQSDCEILRLMREQEKRRKVKN